MKTVYLSPSIQEKNIGYGSYGSEEMRMNEVANVVQKILVEHGVTVYRNKPEWSLGKVIRDSNRLLPDIHFAIHSNACNAKSRGCEVFCHRFGSEGEKLAWLVYENIEKITPTKDRGVKQGYSFYGKGKHMVELSKTYAPAVLVEVTFHDNKEDATWILSNIEKIGTALAKAILKYFDIPYIKDSIELENAIRFLNKHGIIKSPEYWLNNAEKGKSINGEYAAILIKNIAVFLAKNKEKG